MPRAMLAMAGCLILAVIWLLPLEAWLGRFPLHMVRHMMLVAVVPPLLILGWPRLGQICAVPVLLAAGAEFLLVWAWHLPSFHGAAATGPAAFAVEQASFLAVGLLAWAGFLGAANPLAGAAGLLLTFMHMTLLGAILVLAPRDVYAAACGTDPDLAAQQIGGMIMLGLGTPIYLVAGLTLVARALNLREAGT
ncbi:cytochrome c oxidase assembly protein [Falsirhodobacter algicola]|uniref:Cytochrome-c oxidase n=1 Tax=Falsirhodobacter algicola TaxID=2692330 RepID=A0A8J8SKC4_9RHOB|nr:cytochrome c oxidase assembly protein [Falsirhodobacter algicola]QUS35264.1 cytochrome-c oxidase [Falsirhodobacter algicola]